jgi:hypothetical protein
VIKLKVDGVEYKIGEDNFGDYQAHLSDAATAAKYAGGFAQLWSRIEEMAKDWAEYPDEYSAYEGYLDLLARVAQVQGVWPDATPEQNVAEPIAEHMVAFKRVWVEISMDPSEGGTPSDYLAAKSQDLYAVLLQIGQSKAAGILNLSIPRIFTVSNDFLANKFKCHHDPAKEIRDVLSDYPFAENLLNEPAERTQREQQLAQEWNELFFSTRT